jgi:hypothetical protein
LTDYGELAKLKAIGYCNLSQRSRSMARTRWRRSTPVSIFSKVGTKILPAEVAAPIRR